MRLFGKTLDQEICIIAEIGVNHEGSVEAAERIMNLMADAGVDAVKLQSYTPSRFISSADTARFERVTRFGLSLKDHEYLFAKARARGIRLFSTPVTEDWIPFLSENAEAIKVASGDLTFEPLIRTAAQTRLPVIVSTGCSSIEEVDQAVRWVKEECGSQDLRQKLVLMHCVSAYPTPIEEANLKVIPHLAERYGLHVGYSNHVPGSECPLAAVALGASVLEVHVTDRREGREFRDHHLSLEAPEVAQLVRSARAIKAALGSSKKAIQPCELPARDLIRKGVVAARDLPAGTILERKDLIFARPATEVPSGDIQKLIGSKLPQEVKSGMPIPRTALNP